MQYLLNHLEGNDNELVITSEEPVLIVLRNAKISKRDALCNVHEEADFIIVNQLVYLTDQGARNILVVCDDTDVFILLIYVYCGKDINCGVIMESPVPGRTVMDIKATADKHKYIVEHLPGVHALSGCDTSYFFSTSKATILKVLNNGKSVKQLGMADVDMVDTISEAQLFMSMCYNVENDGSMSETQYKVWFARMAKVNICSAPKLRSLPPTLDAFAQHVYRAHYQTMIWKSALDSRPPEAADPTKYGWQEEDGKPAPVMLPQNAALAPVEVLQMIKCGCTSTRPCSTARCKCILAQMSCSVL